MQGTVSSASLLAVTPLSAACIPAAQRYQPNTSLTRRLRRRKQPTLPPPVRAPRLDWLLRRANRTPTSAFAAANREAGIRTHILRRNHGRLSRLRSIEIWQLHRWDNRPEAVSLYISAFSRNTILCEPGVATVKKQPFEVKSFRQHEQKEKGLEDRKR